MKVFIRVDANEVISGGHVARCLSLADAFRHEGFDVTFACSDRNLSAAVSAAGFECEVVGGDWRDLRSDGGRMLRLLEGAADPVLVVDSYSITREFVEEAAGFSRVCYLGSKQGHLGPLDAIVNYSTTIDRAAYERDYGGSRTALLLGPRYAPLRSQFRNLPLPSVPVDVGRILISTGGTDPLAWRRGSPRRFSGWNAPPSR